MPHPEDWQFHQDMTSQSQPPEVVDSSASADTRDLHEQDFETWVIVEIPKQYEEQSKTLDKLGLLQILPECGEYGIVGIDGREYPIPTLESIQSEMRDNREKYETKQKQGFVKLQLTPFGLPLEMLITILGERLVDHYKKGMLFGVIDTKRKLELRFKAPLYVDKVWVDPDLPEGRRGADVNGNCVYHPTSFDKTNHGGLTKQEILDNQASSNSPFIGWEVKLLEDTVIIPSKNISKTIGGREQLVTDKTSVEYLQQLVTDPTYRNEQGLTFEDWITLFLTHLETTNQVIETWNGSNRACYLLGSFSKTEGEFGSGQWEWSGNNGSVVAIVPTYHKLRNFTEGIRSAVPIGS